MKIQSFVALLCTSIITCTPMILKQDDLNIDRIEPLTCSSYKELIQLQKKKGLECIVARVSCKDHAQTETHYFDARLFNLMVFNGSLLPQTLTSFFINPLNGKPVVDEITYVALTEDGGLPLGSVQDLASMTAHGTWMRTLFQAQYETNTQKKATAMFNLGYYYLDGSGIPANRSKAHFWLEQAATQQDEMSVQAHAHAALAQLYAQEPHDSTQVARHLHAAARQQQVPEIKLRASYQLAELYRLGTHLPADAVQALRFYETVAAGSDPQLAYLARLGQAELYRLGGSGLQKNYARARELYTSSLDAKKSEEAIAWHGLALMLQSGGYGITQNIQQAINYHTLAANQATYPIIQALSSVQLGEIYRLQLQQHDKAATWFTKAAQQTSYVPAQQDAYIGLAELQRCSANCDGAKTCSLYKQITSQPDSLLYPIACNGMGYFYHHGLAGIKQNGLTAHDWYFKAAQQAKDPRAQAIAYKNLGELYQFGTPEIAAHMETALSWYEKAVQQKTDIKTHIEAQEALAAIYWKDTGIHKNIDKAIDCYGCLISQHTDKQAQERAQQALKKIQQEADALHARAKSAMKS